MNNLLRASATGREDTVVYYCARCGDVEEPQDWRRKLIRTNKCHCGAEMRHIAWERGAEDAEATAIVRKATRRPTLELVVR